MGELAEREELNVTRFETSLELVARASKVKFPSFASLRRLDVVAGLRLFAGAIARRIVLVYVHCDDKASIQRKIALVASGAKRRARSLRQEVTQSNSVNNLERTKGTGTEKLVQERDINSRQSRLESYQRETTWGNPERCGGSPQ